MGRRVVIVVGGLLTLLLVALLAAPALLQGRIARTLEAAIDEELRGDVSYDSVSVSLLGTFPRLGVDLRGVTVMGEGAYEDVMLLYAAHIDLGLDLWSVLFGDRLVLEYLLIDQPHLDMRVAADGTSNLDLFPPHDADAPSAAWSAAVDHLELRDLQATYVDLPAAVNVQVEDLDVLVEGVIGSAGSTLDVRSAAAAVTAQQADIAWLSEAAMSSQARLTSDGSGVLTLVDSEATVNALQVALAGTIAPHDDGTDVDVALSAPSASLAGLLSLIPDAYGESFEGLAADGTVTVAGSVKGRVPLEGDDLPAFTFEVAVEEGHFQFPDRPVGVKDVSLAAVVEHPPGPLDDTTIEVSTFAFHADRSAFQGSLAVAHPATDPSLDLAARGHLDLAELATVFPGTRTGATGAVDLDVLVRGRQSDFEAVRTEAIHAQGRIRGAGLRYVDPAVSAVPLQVESLDLTLQGAGARLADLQLRWASADQPSDLSISGDFDRFLPYFLDGASLLSGRLSLRGSHTDFRAWSDPGGTDDPAVILTVPANLALDCGLAFERLVLDAISLDDMSGTLAVADGVARLQNVEGASLGGQLVVDGAYVARGDSTASLDVSVRTVRVDLASLVSQFETLRRIAPVLQGAVGELDSTLALKVQLLPDGSPMLATMSASGALRTLGLSLRPAVLRDAAKQLGQEDAVALDLHKAKLAFEIVQGRLDVQPFTLKLGSLKATGKGTAALLNRAMDLSFVIPMKARKLRGTPFLASLGVDVPRNVDVLMRIQGAYDAPTLSLSAPGIRDVVRERVDEAIDDVRKAAIRAATERGDRLVAEATERAEAIRAEAVKAADALRELANRKSERLVEDAGSDLVRRALAREAARVAVKQAGKVANRLESEAEERSGQLVQEAEAQRQQWIDEAASG